MAEYGEYSKETSMEIIETRTDGSFVILKNGLPYQVIPDMEEWAAVCEIAGVDPETQAGIYAAAHAPAEPPVAEEPVEG